MYETRLGHGVIRTRCRRNGGRNISFGVAVNRTVGSEDAQSSRHIIRVPALVLDPLAQIPAGGVEGAGSTDASVRIATYVLENVRLHNPNTRGRK